MNIKKYSRYKGLTEAAAVLALAAVSLFGGSPAHAQRAGGDDFGLGSTWQVGGAVFMTPKFEGSKSYSVYAFPFVAPASLGTGEGFVQVKGLDDFRFRVLKYYGFEAGPLAGYRFGRDSSDSSKLAGFADIDGGFVVGGYAGYRFSSLFLSASYHHQVSGDDTGGVVRLKAEQTLYADGRNKLVGSLGTNIASKDYMTTYFGVSPAQAGLLPVYNASAGFKDVNVGLTATIELSRSWTLYATGSYARLLGDAADSPVIDTSNQFFAGLGLSYKFDLGR